jgi:hypothetical protein
VSGAATINDAITNTLTGGTVNVLQGTYHEAQVDITKALNVVGAGADVTTIDGGSATSLTNPGLVSIRANAADVTFSGFTLQNAGETSGGVDTAIYAKDQTGGGTYTISNNVLLGSGAGTEYGLYAYGDRGTLDFGSNVISGMNSNNILLERQFGASRVHDNTFAAGLDGSSAYFNFTYNGDNITTLQQVDHNVVTATTGSGIIFNSALVGNSGTFSNIQITDNTITDLGANRRGITLTNSATGTGAGGNITGATIQRNSITGVDAAGSAGVRLFGQVTGAQITNNDIRNVESALLGQVGSGADPANVATGTTLTDNTFMSDTNGVNWEGTSALDASNNWWGNSTGPTVGSNPLGTGGAVVGAGAANVDYSPWLSTGTDTDSNPIGFTGDFSQLTVSAGSPQASGTAGNLTEGVADVAADGILTILTGTYTENVDTTSRTSPVTLAPAGSVAIDGDLALGSSTTLAADVNGSTAGIGYDQLSVKGTVSLAGHLTLNSTTPVPVGTAVVLIDNDDTDAVSGTFAGLPEGATVTATSGQNFTISYAGETGNDVILVAQTPPSGSPSATTAPGGSGSTSGSAHTPVRLFAVANANGVVSVFNANGTLRAQGDPFGGQARDVRVTTGDINGDGVDDILLAIDSGTLAGSVVGIDGATLTFVGGFQPFGAFPGGTNVAIGDVNGDGRNDLVVSTAAGAGFVRAYDIAHGGGIIANFNALPGFTTGASLAVANVDGVGPDEIVVGVASNGPPIVAVYNAGGQLLDAFLAYNFPYSGGLNVAAGDAIGDGKAEILVAPATSGAMGMVELFSYGNHAPIAAAAIPFANAGTRVAVTDVNGDGSDDVAFGAAPGTGSWVGVFNLRSMSLIGALDVYPGDTGGVYLG